MEQITPTTAHSPISPELEQQIASMSSPSQSSNPPVVAAGTTVLGSLGSSGITLGEQGKKGVCEIHPKRHVMATAKDPASLTGRLEVMAKLDTILSDVLAFLASSAVELATVPKFSSGSSPKGVQSFTTYLPSLERFDTSQTPETARSLVLSYQLHQKSPELGDTFEARFTSLVEAGVSAEEAGVRAVEELEISGALQAWESRWILDLSKEASSEVSEEQSSEEVGLMLEMALVEIQAGNRPV